MTYSHNGTLKRIDRFYHQTQINHLVTNLIDYEDNQCGLSHTLPGAHSLHHPVGIRIIDPNISVIKQHKEIFKMNTSLLENNATAQILLNIISKHYC